MQPPSALGLRGDLLPSQQLTERFTRISGLPSDTVWVARQGPGGYLWVGTKNGLVRLDGLSFNTFNTQEVGARRTAYFTSLPPGDSTFSVTAS